MREGVLGVEAQLERAVVLGGSSERLRDGAEPAHRLERLVERGGQDGTGVLDRRQLSHAAQVVSGHVRAVRAEFKRS